MSLTFFLSPSSRCNAPPLTKPEIIAGRARSHLGRVPWQVVVFSPRSNHDFWANRAMKQLLVEKQFHFAGAPHEKTLEDVHTHEQFFHWLKVGLAVMVVEYW